MPIVHISGGVPNIFSGFRVLALGRGLGRVRRIVAITIFIVDVRIVSIVATLIIATSLQHLHLLSCPGELSMISDSGRATTVSVL